VTTTKDIKDGWDAVMTGVGRLTAVAEVGALDEKNAQKLAWAEFGTVTAPPRPTLTVTTDRLRPAIARAIQREVGDVLDGKGRGVTGQEILGDVGEALAEEVQHAIDGNTPPLPLAPSTLATRRRRGQGDRTLVATGEMMRSIKAWAVQGERLPDDE
jgi:hypothetical protein